jgi:hypothetical protein
VIFRAATLRDLPVAWTGAHSAGRSAVAEALSSPAPDLVVLLGTAGVPPTVMVNGTETGAEVRSDVRTVDASVPEERLRAIVAGLIWERLAERWNALDRRSTENRE